LRTLSEAAGIGAREGRARLLLELLSVGDGAPVAPEPRVAPPPVPASTSRPAAPAPVRAALSEPEPVRAPEPVPPPAPAVPSTAPIASTSPAAPRPDGAPDVAFLRSRWADVVERATPVIKPLLRECRPVALDGARLTLAFPEGRDFMRTRIAQRASAIEALLVEMFGGRYAIECVASNVELEPLSVEQAVGDPNDPDARALLEGVLKITGGELVDAPEVR
ncbi:MAG: hypothetical protein ACRDGJ_05225, partial [Candidatus Limnocylindria bacterium]